ncbi:hypothetical protein [Aurantimonas marianensis]|uniref:Uncharacterized protein n=1 Tax=Aurantimonas marianensis TaxID=2920428 RepID=A0A9X2KEX5_9HYPH|nr:hypothetical protein [Aurantimonas marianensis]MCP3055853.1 hypothetical protein [Aurantimonas marianensis]
MALALGAEPIDEPPYDPLHEYRTDTRSDDEKAFAKRIDRMATLVVRHFGGQFRGATITPTTFLNWLWELELWVPDGMAEAVERFDRNPVDWKARAEKAEQSRDQLASRVSELEAAIADGTGKSSGATRERESLLKLIIGMATGGYGYDPMAARSPIPADIATDLQTHGVSLSEDTIRKYLREGAELLPQQDE